MFSFKQSYRLNNGVTVKLDDNQFGRYPSFLFYCIPEKYRIFYHFLTIKLSLNELTNISVCDLSNLCQPYFDEVIKECMHEQLFNDSSLYKKTTLIRADKTICTFNGEYLHSFHGNPAIRESITGLEYYYYMGKLHREILPAVISPSGSLRYFTHGTEVDSYDTHWIRPKTWSKTDIDALIRKHPLAHRYYVLDILKDIEAGKITRLD